MTLQVKVHPSRRHDWRPGCGRPERQGETGHRHGVRIVGVHDRRFPLPDDARQLPCRGQIDFVSRRQRHQIRTFERSAIELSLRVRYQHLTVMEGAQPEDGQEDLILSAAPGPGGVDVEGEHSSQSFANLRPT